MSQAQYVCEPTADTIWRRFASQVGPKGAVFPREVPRREAGDSGDSETLVHLIVILPLGRSYDPGVPPCPCRFLSASLSIAVHIDHLNRNGCLLWRDKGCFVRVLPV